MRHISISKNYSILKHSQKKGAGTPAYTRFINRWLGRLMASVLASFKVNPNLISLISSAITILSFLLFLIVDNITYLHSAFFVFLLYFSYAMDSADGQLARLLNKQSKEGEWLDHTLDAIKVPVGHSVAIFLILKNMVPQDSTIIFYLLILSFACANFFSGILKGKLLNEKSTPIEKKEIKNSITRSFLTLPLDYGVFILLFLFAPKPNIFVILYSVWGAISIFYTIVFFIKSWKELVDRA